MSYQPAGACIVSGLINKKSVQESRIYAFATHLLGIIAKIQPIVKRKVTETTGTKNQFYALFMLANG